MGPYSRRESSFFAEAPNHHKTLPLQDPEGSAELELSGKYRPSTPPPLGFFSESLNTFTTVYPQNFVVFFRSITMDGFMGGGAHAFGAARKAKKASPQKVARKANAASGGTVLPIANISAGPIPFLPVTAADYKTPKEVPNWS